MMTNAQMLKQRDYAKIKAEAADVCATSPDKDCTSSYLALYYDTMCTDLTGSKFASCRKYLNLGKNLMFLKSASQLDDAAVAKYRKYNYQS